MTRTFVELPSFQKAWEDIGLNDDDLLELENKLLLNPNAGRVIKGSGGARKVRFEIPGKGKRGGARVIYVNIIIAETTFLLFAYPKSEKDDLTSEEIKNIHKMILELKSKKE